MIKTFAMLLVAGTLVAPATGEASNSLELLQAANQAEAEHRFADAQRYLRQQLEINPRDGASWLKLASIATVRADVNTADEACRRASSHVDPVAALACRGRIALVTQDYAIAYEPLKRLLAHELYRERADVWTNWACGVAAELAVALERSQEADDLFARALAHTPSLPLQAAWLDHLLATGRAQQLLREVAPSEAQPALQLRRLIALRVTGREGEGIALRNYYDWEYRYALEHEEYLHAREIALFYLDVLPQPQLALQAAEHNLDLQREDLDYALYRRALALGPPIGQAANAPARTATPLTIPPP